MLVMSREHDHTLMRALTDGAAKGFAKQLIRDNKAFDYLGAGTFIVWETNHPNKWEA